MLNKSKANIIKKWLPVLAFMSLIFYGSSIPGTDIPSLFPLQDITFHLLVYLMLAFFFSRALKDTCSAITSLRIILFTILFGIFYGITDEFHQAFVPNRSVSGFDVFIDSMGSISGSLIFAARKRIFGILKLPSGIIND